VLTNSGISHLQKKEKKGVEKKKEDNVPILMATEKTTEIKSDIFFSYRA
jgi:hypothetical protein